MYAILKSAAKKVDLRHPEFVAGLKTYNQLYKSMTDAGASLKNYPTGRMGLTPDAVKFSKEFQADKKAYDHAFKAMRDFNSVFVKKWGKELREHTINERTRKRDAAK